jgi:hypothetical protein
VSFRFHSSREYYYLYSHYFGIPSKFYMSVDLNQEVGTSKHNYTKTK